ncbi:MAG: PilZ domain-containing protein [Pseudomonadota bacterium]
MSFLSKLISWKSGKADLDAEISEEPSEQRSDDRPGVYKVVTVTYPSGYVRKGIVVDLSDTGLRVRFSQRGELPGRLDLKIEGLAGARTGEVVWQETHDAGIRFLG